MARACLLANGVKLQFGSFEECLAIAHINRERHLAKASALISAGLSGDSVQSLLKTYDEIGFPELEGEKLRYMAKAKAMMDRIKGQKILVQEQR